MHAYKCDAFGQALYVVIKMFTLFRREFLFPSDVSHQSIRLIHLQVSCLRLNN